jgi:hypothetical protein
MMASERTSSSAGGGGARRGGSDTYEDSDDYAICAWNTAITRLVNSGSGDRDTEEPVSTLPPHPRTSALPHSHTKCSA